MPVYEARRRMQYGPGRNPAWVDVGDEIPSPVKKSLLERGWVAEVEQFSGRPWSEIAYERDVAEQDRIDKMPEGPKKIRAQEQLDSVPDKVPPPATLHATRLAEPGDYFNVENPKAEKKLPEPGEEHKNKSAIDAMLVGKKKLEAALDFADRERVRIAEIKSDRKRAKANKELGKWLSDIDAQVAGLQASETVPAAPAPVAPAENGGRRGRSKR